MKTQISNIFDDENIYFHGGSLYEIAIDTPDPEHTDRCLINFQDGDAEESGRNGVSVHAVLIVALARLSRQHEIDPSREKALAATRVQEALMWLCSEKVSVISPAPL